MRPGWRGPVQGPRATRSTRCRRHPARGGSDDVRPVIEQVRDCSEGTGIDEFLKVAEAACGTRVVRGSPRVLGGEMSS